MGKAGVESGISIESYSHLEQQCHTSWEQWSALCPPPLYRGTGSVSVPHFAQGWRLVGLLLPLTPLRLPFSPIPLPLSLSPLLPAMAFQATSPNYAAVRSMWNPADTFFLDISSCKTYSGSLNNLCSGVNERPEQRRTAFHLRNSWFGGVLIIRK